MAHLPSFLQNQPLSESVFFKVALVADWVIALPRQEVEKKMKASAFDV